MGAVLILVATLEFEQRGTSCHELKAWKTAFDANAYSTLERSRF
jgi:hypothetical protein